MITANLATYPARIKSLQKVIESILVQVDILNVYLNEYDEIPEFLDDPRINCVLGKNAKGNIKDNGKFYFLDKVPDGSYYFTIDDDIIYPKDYVENLIKKLKKYNDSVVVGVHGINFNKGCRSFIKDRETEDFRKYLLYDRQMMVLGTGTIAFKLGALKDLSQDHFLSEGMADLYFSSYCLQNSIPLIAIERGEKWLSEYASESSMLWNDAIIDDSQQTDFIRNKKLWDVDTILPTMDGDFSVIIPCYNLGSLLPEAIDSVFAQTLDDVEVIVVDDASSDSETKDVLKDLEDKVQVIYLEKNGGVSVARNEGIKHAKSEYILCLDADDTIEPTYLEKAKNVFDADEKVGLVSCWAQFFGDKNWIWKAKDKMSIVDALVSSPVHTATCFRKSLHDIGGGYDEKLRGYEDWDHWLKIIKQNCVVRVIPEALFNYYVRPGSKVKTSNKNSKDLVAGIVNNHRELYEKHVDVVVAQKHYNWAMCDTRNAQLENELEQCCGVEQQSIKEKYFGMAVRLKKKIYKKPFLK